MCRKPMLMVAILASAFEHSALIVLRPQQPFAIDDLEPEPRGGLDIAPPLPYFSGPGGGGRWSSAPNVTTQPGQDAHLHCRVNDLGSETVSWVKHLGHNFELLTFGHLTYTSDERYSLSFEEPNDWKLIIHGIQPKDAGVYECQVSSHPPLARCTHLIVQVPVVEIVDSSGQVVAERFYRLGSTIELSCWASALHVQPARLSWMHDQRALKHDTTRGGISVKTEVVTGGLSSRLSVARARRADSGTYSCILNNARAHVNVHVLSGEHADAMQYGSSTRHSSGGIIQIITLLLHFFIHVLFQNYYDKR